MLRHGHRTVRVLGRPHFRHDAKPAPFLWKRWQSADPHASEGSRAISSLENARAWYLGTRLTLNTYFAGAAQLWQETRRVIEMSAYRTETLSRRDRLLRKQVPRQLLRVIPIVLNPIPPPFGWLIIIYAYRNPRQMLTPQFWSPELKTRFINEDADLKRAQFSRLLEMAGCDTAHVADNSSTTAVEIDAAKGGALATNETRSSLEAVREAIRSLCATQKTEERGHALPFATRTDLNITDFEAQQRAIADAVVPFESQRQLGLDVLPKPNLVALAAASMPRMNVQAIEQMPSFGLVRRLERIAAELREDDGLLRSEGLDDLSVDEMRDAAVARGLVEVDDDAPILRSKLAAWIAILDVFEDSYTKMGTKARGLPASLVLYFPALLATTPYAEGALLLK